MSEPVFIFGTGGHARDVAEVVRSVGRTPVLVARGRIERDQSTSTDQIILEEVAVKNDGADFAIGIGDNHGRARVAAAYPHLRFPAIMHPDISLAQGQRTVINAARGTIVFAGVRMMAGVTVGAFCTFNLNATLSHDCDFGDFVNLAPGANVSGNVRIGRSAWIGAGAVINQGTDTRKLEVGTNTIIGSGAVVLGDCLPHSVYVGNPARKIK